MNKKIVVAGAGHGGLVAAYNLAKSGYEVTVYEKMPREKLGHDWRDTMSRRIFGFCSLPQPDDSVFGEYEVAVFNSPYKNVAVGKRGKVRESLGYADRIWLINYLIDCCMDAGVSFEFSRGVKSAVTEGNKVAGIELEDGEKVFAPLVIDACGMHSPVRRSLSSSAGIQKEITADETFYVFRAYYNYSRTPDDTAKYNIYFFNCGRLGLDWVIREDEAVDVLVGGFGGLKPEDAESAVNGFRDMFTFIGDRTVRGGQIKTIPVRKTLSSFICDGYAAVGDSASMVEPLSGSGINLSFYGGKYLADTVIAAATDDYTKKTLWPYQYTYLASHGNNQLQPDILKNFLTSVSCDDIEYLFASRFLTDKELGGSGEKKTPKDIFDKVKSVVCRPAIVPALLKTAGRLMSIGKVCKMLPKEYDAEKIAAWKDAYEKL